MLFPFRSPLLREWSLFLGLLRCFSSAGALYRAYVFSPECLEISPGGLLHSGILGLTFALNYPRLIAEFYAIHRLLVPRHPPCAPCILTHLSSLFNADGSRVAAIQFRNESLRVFFALVTLNHFPRYSVLTVHFAVRG